MKLQPSYLIRTIAISLALSLVSVAAVVFWLGDPRELQHIRGIPPRAIIASAVLLLISHLFGGLRLVVLARLAGRPLSLPRGTRAYILGLFSSALTPSGSGHGPAIAFSLQHSGFSSAMAWSLSIYSSVLDLLFYAWSVPLALVYLTLGENPILGPQFVYLAVPLGLALLTLWFLLAYRQRWLGKLAVLIFSLRPLKRHRRRTMRFVHNLSVATNTLNQSSTLAHLTLQSITTAIYISLHSIFYLLVRSMGGSASYPSTLALLVTVSIGAYIIPTPGGSGYLELMTSYLFHDQLADGLIAPVVVTWRIFCYYLNFVLGPILAGTMLGRLVSRIDTPTPPPALDPDAAPLAPPSQAPDS